jgi:hypothetical protein
MDSDWRITVLESIDYLCLAVFLLLLFIHPWVVKRGSGSKLFWFPMTVSFFWAFWRLALFDPVMSIDVPGIGYLVVGFTCGIMALIFYGARLLIPKHLNAARLRRAGESGTLD